MTIKADIITNENFIGDKVSMATGYTKDGRRKEMKAVIYFRSNKIFYDVYIENAAGSLTYDNLDRAIAAYNNL